MTKSIALNILNLIVTSISIFLLYKLAIDNYGITKIGIWSLITALVSFSKIIENGFIISSVKLVSQTIEDEGDLSKLITNLIIGAIVSSALIMSVIYIPIYIGLDAFYPDVSAEAKELLPLATIGIVISSTSLVINSILDGYRKFQTKLIINIISAPNAVLVFYFFLKDIGLVGLIYAQILQSTIVALLSLIILINKCNITISLNLLSIQTLKMILKFSKSINIINFTHLISEPTTKVLFAKFGGIEAAALFDISLKIINQARSLLVVGNQTILAYITQKYEKNGNSVAKTYNTNVLVIALTSAFFFHIIALFSVEISYVLFSTKNAQFITTINLLLIAVWISCGTIPGYYLSISQNSMRINTNGHISLAILNAILASSFGLIFGWQGVLVGYFIASVSVSVIMIFLFERKFSTKKMQKKPIRSVQIITAHLFLHLIVAIPNTEFWAKNDNQTLYDYGANSLVGKIALMICIMSIISTMMYFIIRNKKGA